MDVPGLAWWICVVVGMWRVVCNSLATLALAVSVVPSLIGELELLLQEEGEMGCGGDRLILFLIFCRE